MLVAGVDGCRAGWLVVRATVEPFTVVSMAVAPDVGPVLSDEGLAFVAVDMPIGLPDDQSRACDVAARKLLGPRRSSVFPAPMRSVLGASDYRDALDRSRRACGVGLSKQTWNIVPRIAELDAAIDADRQQHVRETHPELCFARLGGAPPAHPKRSAAGRAERIALVGEPPPTPPGAAADDVLDALVLAHAAARFARGEGRSVGDDNLDARGLAMTIWW